MEYKIKKSFLDDMFEMAQNMYPNELLCFLYSKENIIEEFVLLPSTNGRNFASVETRAIPFDKNIVGTLHSHPFGRNKPSTADKKMFQKYSINIILGFKEGYAFYNNKSEEINPLII